MLCQLLGQHWSVTWAHSVSRPGSRACWQITKISWPLPPPLHLQMKQHAPDNHVLDLVVVCMLFPLQTLLLHAALLLLWLRMAMYSRSSQTPLHYSSDQGHPGYHHLEGSQSWPLPWTRERKQEENVITNERESETPCPQAIHSCLPISVTMYPSRQILMGLRCNLCPLRLPLHHIIHNHPSTAGMLPP